MTKTFLFLVWGAFLDPRNACSFIRMAGCTSRCRQGVLKLIQSLQRLVSGTLTKGTFKCVPIPVCCQSFPPSIFIFITFTNSYPSWTHLHFSVCGEVEHAWLLIPAASKPAALLSGNVFEWLSAILMGFCFDSADFLKPFCQVSAEMLRLHKDAGSLLFFPNLKQWVQSLQR